MYSTIFAAHPTVIKHPTPQPKGLGVNPETAKAFALSDEATALAERMKNGSYSVPVKLESRENSEDKDGSFESPNFVQNREILKNEKERLAAGISSEEKNPEKFLREKFKGDVNILLSNLENKKDKEERIATRNIIYKEN